MHKKIILVTGGSSYLGLSFLDFVLKVEENIKIYSTYNNNKPKLNNKKLKWIKLDINNINQNFDIYKSVEFIIHLAWSNLENFNSKSHISKILPSHKFFFRKLLSQNKKIKKIIVIGTCLEYGLKYKNCLDESLKPDPNTPYGFAKYELYKYLKDLKPIYKYKLDWCRLFYVYGKAGVRNSLWKKFINQKTLIIRQPSTIRDFIHVDDIAVIIKKMIFSDYENDVINICSGQKNTIKNLIKLWVSKYNSKIKVNFIEEKKTKYQNFWGCTSKLNKFLNMRHN